MNVNVSLSAPEQPRGAIHTRIATEIRLAEEGRQEGFLSLPVSTDDSAYGRIQIPIVSLKNGVGPRVLLVAGNHGDEYEGQIALLKLARELTIDDIRGHLTILAAANLPAALEGRRNSPLDGGNLNRSFPGNPDGSPTEMIAHYIEHVLLPKFDVILDLHSGGTSLAYVPCVWLRLCCDETRTQRSFDLMRAFGAPIAYVSDGRNGGADRTLSAAADRRGVVCMTTELGGGGTVGQDTLRLAEDGLRRVLHYLGMLASKPPSTDCRTRVLEVQGLDYYVFAPENGLVEPMVALEESVEAGQPAATIHFVEAPWRTPEVVRFRRAGVVICQRVPGRARRGDCLYQIATDRSP